MTASDTPVPRLGAHLVGSVPLESADAVFRAVTDRLGGRVTRIPDGETGDRVGWDVSPEFIVLEGAWRTQLADIRGGVARRLAELGNYVPAEVALGYHLCYGDLGHRHIVEPRDTGNLVDIANRVAAALTRPLNWVHATDGAAGARRRIAAAAPFRDAFGVGTECGLGRRAPAGIPALLDLHRAIIDGSLS